MTPERVVQALERLVDQLAGHAEPSHRWRKVGSCVWCTTCQTRLYQGSVFTAAERAELVAYRQQRDANADKGSSDNSDTVTSDGAR